MFLPLKIKVGFNKREDTFTKKLSYVTYFKGNKLAQEASWNSWRDHSIPVEEFDNVPTKGFVINKGINRISYFGKGATYVRIYDPRGFEFEISSNNILEILR